MYMVVFHLHVSLGMQYTVIMPLCTKEIFLFTPKEMQDIYLLQSIIVGVKHNFLLIQIVANTLNTLNTHEGLLGSNQLLNGDKEFSCVMY